MKKIVIKKRREKKYFTISVGFGIGVIMLIPVICVLLFIYTVLSANFKNTLVDYSLSLIESMTTQGIDGVERELENSLTESIFNSKKYRFGKGYNRRNF